MAEVMRAETSRARSVTMKSSRPQDNSFRNTGLYLGETSPLSFHFGELRLPVFCCHPEVSAVCPPKAGWHILARPLRKAEVGNLTTPSLFFCPAISSALVSLCLRASPPARTEAETAPQSPACY